MAGKYFVPLVTLGDGTLSQFRDLERGLRAFPKLYKQALVHVLMRVRDGVRTDGVAAVTKRYTLNSKKVRAAFHVNKPHFSKPFTHIYVRGPRALHLADWDAKQGRDGVSARIRKDTPKSFIRSAFIVPGKNSGKPIVFRRVGTSRKDIKAVYSTTGLEILGNARIVKVIMKGASRRMINQARHSLKNFLEKAGVTL